MELQVIKNENVPIKAIPEAKLNSLIISEGGLSDWLCQLLSIKPTDENVSRLEVLLPMVKENCWSMPISEIKNAFLMYVQGKLSIEPVDNYLTAILFSKVITAYKQQRKPEPVLIESPTMSEEEIKETAIKNILLSYEDWEKSGVVKSDYAVAFDRLYEWGILPGKKSSPAVEKKYHNLLCQAHMELIAPVFDKIKWAEKEKLDDTPKYRQLKERYHELNDYNHKEVQDRFRCLVLAGFYKKTDKEMLKSLIEG